MELLNYIANGLFLSDAEARRYISTIPRRYKKYHILKRNGKDFRLIAQPARQVKSLQSAVLNHISDVLQVHESAFAYESSKGIKANALIHCRNDYLLKMDFKNFFLSIKPFNFLRNLKEFGIELSETDVFVIENLFFWKLRRSSPLRLSIGAPSSPKISNVVMYFFDEKMTKKCAALGITYSRYADDLTFSTKVKGVLFNVPKIVREILNEVNLRNIKINHEKTVFSSRKFNRHITGVTITPDGHLSLGRERKRLLRSKIHHYVSGVLSSKEILTLKGEMGYAKFIEHSFYQSMINRYGVAVIDAIAKYEI
ncbi:retron St85 family RNA-directed DNA polymerase [Enterobacter ludwigii]|jgi:retron-type reverse transcriptase|uniref:retron St85 family RNA-directed DNA polymerase n=1 Tax=Enterobacter ludwigii TaxID=299767 RepID=UPI001238DA14|nr:retron St85 family RNA-directed DNA polymerase [Enterobacter ludwigii]MBS0871054.1 retron St85 family RNA-directed DNA polymerase [Enterobacter ludwigii]UOH52235.1 retron St85 family RNA-directed DNA polymerase [Enterobacter ludwigii]HDR2689454.1 retron St85 family RNA-directed DNA polymerase [Enterobacter ludwigii]